MKRVVTILILMAFCGISQAEESDDELLVRVGDSSEAVRQLLGEPTLEFPLKDQLVQDYGKLVITSRGGVVTAVNKRTERKPEKDAARETVPAAPTIQSLTARACEGDADAQYSLAYCYHTGTAVHRNMEAAVRWYTSAAMQGHMAAQHNLSMIYMRGEGVERDFTEAFTWASLAAGNGNGELAEIIRPHITGEQEMAARTRAIRIRNGLEESPSAPPDTDPASAIAHKEGTSKPAAAE